MNMAFFRLINNMAGKNRLLDLFMRFLSQDMIFVVAAVVLLLYVFGFVDHNREERKLAVNTAVFTLLNLGLAALLGVFFYMPRPFVRHRVHLLYPHVADSSFPSDHATATMSVALGIGKNEKKSGLLLMLVSLAVGFSRVYVGHHTPADIVGTYLLVILSDFLYNTFIRRFVDRLYEKVESGVAGRIRTAGHAGH